MFPVPEVERDGAAAVAAAEIERTLERRGFFGANRERESQLLVDIGRKQQWSSLTLTSTTSLAIYQKNTIMFNVARPSQRYDSYNGLTASFVADPLVSSVYEDAADPWSGTGTPAIQAEPSSEFSNVLGVYHFIRVVLA